MNSKTLLAIFVLAMLIIFGVWALRQSGGELIPAIDMGANANLPAEAPPTPSIAPDAIPEGAVMEDGVLLEEEESASGGETPAVREFTVAGRNYSFTPATIRVKKGETVRITFESAGGIHDWKIDEFNAATKQIASGQSETIEFVADKVGTFEYYCSIGSHRAQGMVGTLIVE